MNKHSGLGDSYKIWDQERLEEMSHKPGFACVAVDQEFSQMKELAGELLDALKKYWNRPSPQEVVGDLIYKAEKILEKK